MRRQHCRVTYLNYDLCCKEEFKRKTRWNFKRADWVLYIKTSNQLLCNIKDPDDIDRFNEKDTSTILKAAEISIPKGCRANYKPFWNEEVQKSVDVDSIHIDIKLKREKLETIIRLKYLVGSCDGKIKTRFKGHEHSTL